MKKKILSSILLLVVIFNALSFVAFADETETAVLSAAESNSLIKEISNNMTDETTGASCFDISKYPASESGSPLVIGGYESGIFDELEPSFYIYVYNPSEKELDTVLGKWNGTFTDSDGEKTSPTYATTLTFSIVGKSDGEYLNRFYKLEVLNMSEYYSREELLAFVEHKHAIIDFTFIYKDGTEIVFDNSVVFTFGVDLENKNLKTTLDNKETEILDVQYTCYHHGSVGGDVKTSNQFNTVYFSVPDRYASYFKDIYSISSTYTKKKTAPILWGEFAADSKEKVFLSSDYNLSGTGMSNTPILSADFGVAASPDDLYKLYWQGLVAQVQYNVTNRYSFDNVVMFSKQNANADTVLENSVILKWYEIWQSDGSNKVLFEGEAENCYTTRTINQSFDSLSYNSQADFWDHVADFGFWEALCNAWSGGTFSDEEDIYNIPYIVCCDDTVKKDLQELSKTDFCDKYFIHSTDYEAFKSYLSTYDNVYLYRFDVSEHWSDTLISGRIDDSGSLVDISDNTYGVMQTAYYSNFQVVNITFKNADYYLSVATTSEAQDFVSHGTVHDPRPEDDGWRLFVLLSILAGIIVFVIVVERVVRIFKGPGKTVINVHTSISKNKNNE